MSDGQVWLTVSAALVGLLIIALWHNGHNTPRPR